MNIILFSHPSFIAHQSMPRFVDMIAHGMHERGHQIEVWAPQAFLNRLPVSNLARKWLGYADQYLLFPMEVRRRMKRCSPNTLFVFTDHALGPWVPLVANRPHVIHCHDFLAQRSALGEFPENPTGWSGRQYQAYIRRGYSKGSHFISVSQTTRQDLHRFLPTQLAHSELVYNGLNQNFVPQAALEARVILSDILGTELGNGYLLHIGGNQWYKNRTGIIELYNAWRATSNNHLPLLLIGQSPSEELLACWNGSPFKKDIHLFSDVEDATVRLAYAGATVFLFPSIAEGFGWPIAEAMAAGCPVITIAEAPMTEVGGTAAFYIPRRPPILVASTWAAAGAQVIQQVVMLTPDQRQVIIAAGLSNAGRFDAKLTLDCIEDIYQRILETY